MTQHIVGTRLEDFSQIYNGRIVIKGSLSLQNVQLSNVDDHLSPLAPIESDPSMAMPPAQMLIDGTPFDVHSVPQKYWMKSLDQVRVITHIDVLEANLFLKKHVPSLEFR